MEWPRLEEIMPDVVTNDEDMDPNFILSCLEEEVINAAGKGNSYSCINEGNKKVEWDWQDDHELVWPTPPWELESEQENIIPSWPLWDSNDTDLLQNCTNNHEATTVEMDSMHIMSEISNQNHSALVSWLLS